MLKGRIDMEFVEMLKGMSFCPLREWNYSFIPLQSLYFELFAVLNHHFVPAGAQRFALLHIEFKSLRHQYYWDNKQFCTFSRFPKTQNSSSAIGRGSAGPIVPSPPFVGSVSCSQTKLSCHSGQYWALGCFDNLGKKQKKPPKTGITDFFCAKNSRWVIIICFFRLKQTNICFVLVFTVIFELTKIKTFQQP